jgi:uncharacterized protein (DUF58 family)
MIRPTRRAVLIFAAGIPLSLFIVIYDAALWPLCFNYGVLVLFALLVDALLALPPRRLALRVDMPEKLYIGERGAVLVAIPEAARRRATLLELLSEQRGELDPPGIAAVEVEPGREARVEIPLVPRRRGRIWVDRLWARWLGPMSLVERIKTFPVDRSVDVVPNVRGVQSAALQFFAHEAIFGVKVQQQRGEGPNSIRCAIMRPGSTTASSTGSIPPAITSCSARSSRPSATIRSSSASTPAIS